MSVWAAENNIMQNIYFYFVLFKNVQNLLQNSRIMFNNT